MPSARVNQYSVLRQRSIDSRVKSTASDLSGVIKAERDRLIKRLGHIRARAAVDVGVTPELLNIIRQSNPALVERLEAHMQDVGQLGLDNARAFVTGVQEAIDTNVTNMLASRAAFTAEKFTQVRADSLSQILGQANAESWDYPRITDAITSRWDTLSAGRVNTIARTDLAFAHETAAVTGWQAAGIQSVDFVFGGGPCGTGICPDVASGSPYSAHGQPTADAPALASPLLPPLRPQSDILAADLPSTATADDVAASLIDQGAQIEPGVTSLLQETTEASGGTLEGLANRLKGQESLSRKVDDIVAERGLPDAPSAAPYVSDAVRYTAVFDPADYTLGSESILKKLQDEGFTFAKPPKNYWADPLDSYNGINVSLVHPSGYHVELQFHTPQSLAIKNGELHDLYERYRLLPDGPEKASIGQQMSDLWRDVTVPTGVERVGEPAFQRIDLPPVTSAYPETGLLNAPVSAPVDLNTATYQDLIQVPGIGPKSANDIIAERAKAPFANVDDLQRISGWGPKSVDDYRDRFVAGTPTTTAIGTTHQGVTLEDLKTLDPFDLVVVDAKAASAVVSDMLGQPSKYRQYSAFNPGVNVAATMSSNGILTMLPVSGDTLLSDFAARRTRYDVLTHEMVHSVSDQLDNTEWAGIEEGVAEGWTSFNRVEVMRRMGAFDTYAGLESIVAAGSVLHFDERAYGGWVQRLSAIAELADRPQADWFQALASQPRTFERRNYILNAINGISDPAKRQLAQEFFADLRDATKQFRLSPKWKSTVRLRP
jgi:hypothetical protein